MPDKTTITAIEQGRAKFAYQCARQVMTLKKFSFGNRDIQTNLDVIDALKKKTKSDQLPRALLENAQAYATEDKFYRAYKQFAGEYKSNVKKIPSMMKTNGLGPTFGFLYSKRNGASPHKLIYRQTTEWLKHDFKQLVDFSKSNNDLVEAIVNMDSATYRSVTVEVFSFFNWLRRFAEGMIEGEVES